MTMTDEELEAMEIDWTQGVAENFERVKSAALAAIDAANKRADEAEVRRKCYECGSEMTAEELEVIRKQAEKHRGFRRGAEHAVDIYLDMLTVFDVLDAANRRVAELEAGGCARDQGTTQYCAEAVALQKRVDELERALRASFGHLMNAADEILALTSEGMKL